MKILTVCALALSAGLLASGTAEAGGHHGHYPVRGGHGHGGYYNDDNYLFNCTGKADYQKGAEVVTHDISIDGEIDAGRRTLGGREVTVSVNGHLFAKYNLPQHSIWLYNDELISLNLRGETVRGEAFALNYAGQGSEQNYIELKKKRRALLTPSLLTRDVTCTVERSDW